MLHQRSDASVFVSFFWAIVILFSVSSSYGGLPEKVLVGYWQNWSPLRLNEIHDAYNVIQIAFATTKNGSDSDMEFNLPSGYSKTDFLTHIAEHQAAGHSVILSIGGASDPVVLSTIQERDVFVSSMISIMAEYNYAFDGIDTDFESSSLDFGNWTMANPAQGQLNIIDAVKSIMADYQSNTGKKLLLTMAPENVYIQGALSSWQVSNSNGGAYLPIIEGLMDELDLLHPQYYNAGGSTGGTFANDGQIYYDTGDPDYLTAITETLIEGFTLLNNKGDFAGVPASKVAIGVPSNDCFAAGTGYVFPDSLQKVLQYMRGEIGKPNDFDYTLNSIYPELRGIMTWSINEDQESCSGTWSLAEAVAEVQDQGQPPSSLSNALNQNDAKLLSHHFVGRSLHLQWNGKQPTRIVLMNAQGEVIKQSMLEPGMAMVIETQTLSRGVYYLHSDNNHVALRLGF